jgi:hypothetical protein
MKTILEQFKESAENGEGAVMCPDCGKEVGKWYIEAMSLIENGKCPFCDCEGIELCDGDDIDDHWFERCESCRRQQDCRRDAALSQWEADERSNELLRYHCRGY